MLFFAESRNYTSIYFFLHGLDFKTKLFEFLLEYIGSKPQLVKSKIKNNFFFII